MSLEPLEILISTVSAGAIIVPVLAALRSLFKVLSRGEIRIKDREGTVIKVFTPSNIITADPEELKKFHQDTLNDGRKAAA